MSYALVRIHPAGGDEMRVAQVQRGDFFVHPADVTVARSGEGNCHLFGGVVAAGQHHAVEQCFQFHVVVRFETHD
jgi:hypothetical protein